MGSMLISQCQCGYESETLFIGGGMISMNEEYYVPFYCDDCEIVIERNVMNDFGLKKYNKCPKCRKKVQYYGSISEEKSDVEFYHNTPDGRFDFDRRYNFDDDKNHCPKCKKDNLTFNLVGCWD